MRIYEITDQNIEWNAISGINIDFDKEYYSIIKAVDLIIKLNHKSKYPILLSMIESFENRAEQVLNSKYPDPTDPDIVALKEKLNRMKQHIDQLKSQLASAK